MQFLHLQFKIDDNLPPNNGRDWCQRFRCD